MLNNGKISIKSIDKAIAIVLSFCLLLLSYAQINASLSRRFDEAITTITNGYYYFLAFGCFFVFLLFHRQKKVNVVLWLLFLYLAFGYLAINSLSAISIFHSLLLTFWIFCFSFGNRLVNADKETHVYFVKTVCWVVVLPLSLYCIFKFFTTDMLVDQHAADAFFAIVVYLPFVLMLEGNKIIKTFFYVMLVTVAILSIKRSIIVGVVSCSLVYAILSEHRKVFSKWYFWIVLAGVLLLGYYLYGVVSETIIYRFTRLEEDGGSGRDYIYDVILSSFHQSEWQAKLFGHGYQSVTAINDWKLAHNDLLQLLYDYGIIGVGLYLLLLLSLVALVIKKFLKRDVNKTLYAAFVSSITLFLILSFLNCFVYSTMLIAPIMMALGILDEKIKCEMS